MLRRVSKDKGKRSSRANTLTRHEENEAYHASDEMGDTKRCRRAAFGCLKNAEYMAKLPLFLRIERCGDGATS
jgi:hypothetical protein